MSADSSTCVDEYWSCLSDCNEALQFGRPLLADLSSVGRQARPSLSVQTRVSQFFEANATAIAEREVRPFLRQPDNNVGAGRAPPPRFRPDCHHSADGSGGSIQQAADSARHAHPARDRGIHTPDGSRTGSGITCIRQQGHKLAAPNRVDCNTGHRASVRALE